jgi:hypothetical protein
VLARPEFDEPAPAPPEPVHLPLARRTPMATLQWSVGRYPSPG